MHRKRLGLAQFFVDRRRVCGVLPGDVPRAEKDGKTAEHALLSQMKKGRQGDDHRRPGGAGGVSDG